jgi:Fe-Mn family superoxide dismutase
LFTRRTLFAACASAAAFAGFSPRSEAQAPTPPPPSGPFQLPPLGYAYDALEPYIDAETMHLHHDKHHKAYVDNLNKAVAPHPEMQKMTVDELLIKLNTLPPEVRTAVRNQGGGHANHSLFWTTLSTKGAHQPQGPLAADITKTFGSFGAFQTQLSTAATGVFGSGWGWLVRDNDGLKIVQLPNQDSPLLTGAWPVMGIDVWEHAYYLKYKNVRADYVKAIWNALAWDAISDRYQAHLKQA